jgi:DNA-binding CsgD family transcriptional regulator
MNIGIKHRRCRNYEVCHHLTLECLIYCEDCTQQELNGTQILNQTEKVILFYQSRGYKVEDISERLKLRIKQVKSRMESGRKKLNIARGDIARLIWFVEVYLLSDPSIRDFVQEELRKRDTWIRSYDNMHYVTMGISDNGK